MTEKSIQIGSIIHIERNVVGNARAIHVRVDSVTAGDPMTIVQRTLVVGMETTGDGTPRLSYGKWPITRRMWLASGEYIVVSTNTETETE